MIIVQVGNAGHAPYAYDEMKKRGWNMCGLSCGNRGLEAEAIEDAYQSLLEEGFTPKLYNDYKEMFACERPDIAIVNPWFKDTGEIALYALEHGIHVFCEKPIATDMETLDKIERCTKDKKAVLAPMFETRYMPNFLAAKKAVEDGLIGKIRLIDSRKSYKLGKRSKLYSSRDTYCGILPWVAIHAIDWAAWISGEKYIGVSAMHSQSDNGNNGDMDITASAQFMMTNDVIATVTADMYRPDSAQTHGDDRVRIVGTKGIVEVMNGCATLLSDECGGECELTFDDERNIFADFLDQINGVENDLTAASAIEATKWALRADQSACQKQTVYNQKKNVSIVFVGIGGYASGFEENLLDHHPENVQIAGLVDPFPKNCEYIEELQKLAPLYTNLDDFYKEHTADLAIVSTPIQFHTKNVITALEHGSNVLCEKPLCADKNDIEKMIVARDKAGKFVDIGYQWSHNKAVLAMKQDILSGVYGAPKYLKSITLWPRATAYFKRGTGWAGAIRAKDGALIYDSVANNATAHYLHNMFFVLGKEMDAALEPTSIDAFLMRTNPIENFDACTIKCKMPGDVDVLFVAAHSVNKTLDPVCEYVFEKGKITLNALPDENDIQKPTWNFVGVLDNGEKRVYKNTRRGEMNKLYFAIDAVRTGSKVCCPIEAAAVHTKVINEIQERFDVNSAKKELIKISPRDVVYTEGLAEALVDIYCGKEVDLSSFCEAK